MNEHAVTPILDENEQMVVRRKKLAELREQGKAFPNDFHRSHLAEDIQHSYANASADELEAEHVKVVVAGRMMARRLMGKASFTHIQDMSGRIQIYVQKDGVGEAAYADFQTWDIGDIIGISGNLFKTKTGELTIKVQQLQLLTKSLRPLPDKHYGLTDTEQCYRQRYLDLICNINSRATFILRSKVMESVRAYLSQAKFIEVETPMMQVIPGGAAARPFVTHHNALNMDLFLRISPELYLKRLVVGGFEKVFEINRNFRNEGLSTRHNPEFTMIEWYEAYGNYLDGMHRLEALLKYVTFNCLGTHSVNYQGQQLDFAKPFNRMTIVESILWRHPEITATAVQSAEDLRAICKAKNLHFDASWSVGRLQMEIFDKTVESQLLEPTFVLEYPTEVSPLARRKVSNPDVTERFELIICGREIANGFSELNDADDQAERFRKQASDLAAGDHEAMHYDADYVTALEHGLPPTVGVGVGIDRLVMLLTDSASIRDVILFPHMRPEKVAG